MPSFKLALVALAASVVSAQIDLSKIPSCALSPAIAALGQTGCSATDVKCICSSSSFLTSLEPAVAAACSPADLSTETFAVQLCASVGITITIPGSATSTTAAATTSAAPSSSAAVPGTTSTMAASSPSPSASASTSAASATVAAGSSVGVSTVYVTVPCSTSVASSGSASVPSSAPVVPTTKASNATVTATKSATPSVFTGAAAAGYVSSATVFGGMMAALAMLL